MGNANNVVGEEASKQYSKPIVTVESSARLHMGFFDLNGGLGRKFGSIGLSLAEPAIKLNISTSSTLDVFTGNDIATEVQEKAEAICAALLAKLNVTRSVRVAIDQFVIPHSGLGSGTQLALTIGAAINRLFDLKLTTRDIALMTGRGLRSGIGIAAFDYGGLLVDGGSAALKGATQNVPPLLARYDFPEDWRILLIFDNASPGIHGSEEKVAFNALPEFPAGLAAELCRHVLMQAMPAMVEKDLDAFGQSIQFIQSRTGDYFAPAQGGRYASQSVGKVLQYLEKSGVACFGQSSWGPTGFAVFENESIARSYLTKLQDTFAQENLSWLITAAQNHGAQVKLT